MHAPLKTIITKEDLPAPIAYTFFRPPITSCVMRSLLSQTTKCGYCKNCANGFLHFSEPHMRALAYSLLYTFAAILGPPKYSTFSARTPAATSHQKQTMSIIDLDVRNI